MRPYVDEELCITCGQCEEACPAEPNVFRMGDKAEVVHPEACTECGACVAACPVDAIELKE
ncbi:MAG: 4Fe-4S binding protein [Planctomycetes bacterium]|nr:4Fe-4S binding protein [Planctomycetota bacterium]